MKTNKLELLLTLALLVLAEIVSGLARVNVTRLLSNDKFTNPNQTAVNKCRSSGQGSSYLDICKRFDSTNTRAVCSSPGSCCEICQCEPNYATYLPHLGKCVSVSKLNLDVFGQGSNGKLSRFLFLVQSEVDVNTISGAPNLSGKVLLVLTCLRRDFTQKLLVIK